MSVGIIGAGSWGTTLSKIVSDNGYPVRLWARNSELAAQINRDRRNPLYFPDLSLSTEIVATAEMKEVAADCTLILVAVPSHGFRAIVRELGNHVHGEHVVIHCTKGLEQVTHKRMTEILREETCLKKIGVLSGPNLAAELVQRKPAGTLVASRFDEVHSRALAALNNEYFRVYSGSDVIGAEVGGFFKNVVALAAGAVDGLGLGDNTKALLLTRGVAEMVKLGVAMGADPLTFIGMAGFGDLMATCTSRFSRNHHIGELIAQGYSRERVESEMKTVAEGVKTTLAVHTFAREKKLDLPIVNALYSVLYEGTSVGQALTDLLARRTGDELEGLRNLRTGN